MSPMPPSGFWSASRVCALASALTLLTPFWAGCDGPPQPARLTTELPPDIPPPPPISTKRSALQPEAEMLRRREVEKDRYLAFREAFLYARDRQLIPADATPDSSAFQQPVSRSELAQWLVKFAGVAVEDDPQIALADLPPERPDAGPAEIVVRRGWMSTDAFQGERIFHPDAPITREGLCDLAVRLKGEAPALSKIRSAVNDQLRPDTAKESGENFENFRDLAAISPEFRSAVAWAYAHNLIETVFNLSPTDLTAREGFSPRQAVTRQQALTFLARYVLPPKPANAPDPAASTTGSPP
ncbi:MAG: S-layer homology domain-containing protein [Vampirovibrionales bacterium]|nr:S-layer homology domain-containing protein [Vampirovibrionales bacterium]